MINSAAPKPANELERLLNLSEYNIDFTNIESNFKDLNKLAARIAGTDISLVNLIDSYTQWTISSHGLEIKQMPRNESVCQYTINESRQFEVQDLKSDNRFKDFDYVKGDLNLKYYFGVPLTTTEGFNIGALCVMHTETRQLSDDKIEHLTIIADEIVSRLRALKVIERLKARLVESAYTQKKILHDVRGPISGIIGLADIILEQGHDCDRDEVVEYMGLIKNSGDSVIQLANEILLSQNQYDAMPNDAFNLKIFKEKLVQLYLPSALKKNIDFQVNISSDTENQPVCKFSLLQITGNLISNAIKFTPEYGKVTIDLGLEIQELMNVLHIVVKDTGVGLTQKQIDMIQDCSGKTTLGTGGEEGFGFGLSMVKRLIDSSNGDLKISSVPGVLTTFEVTIIQV